MTTNPGVNVLLDSKLISKTELSEMYVETTPLSSRVPSKVVKVKLFCGSATWLLSEYDETNNVFFGLCDLGLGCPELGYVSPLELSGLVQGTPRGLVLERDKYFEPVKDLEEYAQEARKAGFINA